MIQKKPIYVDFDRRRELVFNLNTEILIRSAGKQSSSIWETIGVYTDEAGKEKRKLDVNLENLRTYLWAALQADAARHDEILTEDEVGALLVKRRWVTQAVLKIAEALGQYYGDEPGGSLSPGRKARKGRKRRGKPWTWEDAFRLVCGQIGLAPQEFYALQYSELVLILEGYRERRKQEATQRREEYAWVVSWLLLPHKSKDAEPITPDQLMGRKPKDKRPQFADHRAAAIACFAALKAKSNREVKADA